MNTSPFPGTVLIVEDEALVRFEIAGALRDDGWTVLEAGPGEDANALIVNGHIDVLFADIQLASRLSGWDVAQAFRECRPDGTVLYASGNTIDRSRQVGNSRFFGKPYEPAEIVQACRNPG